MDMSPLLKKLQVKAPATVAVVNAPDGYLDLLAPLPQGIEVALLTALPAGAVFDMVHVFVEDAAAIAAQASAAVNAVRPGGLLWWSYPKKGTGRTRDIHRDEGWQPLADLGWGPVRQVAIDGTWSAIRFRPEADIARRPGSRFASGQEPPSATR